VIRGSRLFVTASSADIRIVALVDPASPRRIARLPLGRNADVLTTFIGERHVFVGGFDGVSIVDLPR